jgi:hypothetical protein
MTYAELSEAQARRSRQFAKAQTDVMSVYCNAERDLKDLQAENAKLRELVRDMWLKNLGRMDYPCSWCVIGCAGDDCDFDRRMSELGIEAQS